MSAPNTTAFIPTAVNVGDTRQSFFDPAPSDRQHYFFLTTSMEMAPAQAPVTASLTEDWGFQPDPNIDGRWMSVLQPHDPSSARRENAEMEYRGEYPEESTDHFYQVSLLQHRNLLY